MTQTPGTPAYMPPEVMIANPKYDTSVDEFSYGILMVHIFSGRWPEPQVGPNRTEPGRLIPVTEAERREVFIRAIGNDHPLMDLILKCIDNHPQTRAHASEIVERLAEMVLQFPASFANRLEMLRQIERVEEEKRALREEGEAENQRKDQQIVSLQKDAEEKEEENIRLNVVYFSEVEHLQLQVRKEAEEKKEEIARLNAVYLSEVEQLKLKVRDRNAQIQLLSATNEADVTELKKQVVAYEDQIDNNAKLLQQQKEDFKAQQERERSNFDAEMAREKEDFEIQLTKERESCKRLRNEKRQLEAEISESVVNTTSLKHKISTLEAETSRNTATVERKESELKAKTRVLEEKEAIISGMREQLTRAREHLTSKQQVSTTR